MQFTHALIRLKDFLGACCAGIIFRHGPRPAEALAVAGIGGGLPFAPKASSTAALRHTFCSVGQAIGQTSAGASGVQAGPPMAPGGPSTPATEFGYQLQHFSQRAHVLASLAINKKLPARQAFLDLEKLWEQIAELGQALEEIPEAVKSALEGLTGTEAEERLEKHGLNEVAHEKKAGLFVRLVTAFKNPLVLLLLALATVSYLSDDMRATVVISAMAFLSVALRVIQEAKADNAAEQLQAMVHTTATVLRDGVRQEVPLKHLVPGDVVFLSAGDMVPADVQLTASKDLFVNQAMLTGEAMPVEKYAAGAGLDIEGSGPTLERPNICLMGTNVESGSGTAVVITTGAKTYFGGLAGSMTQARTTTSFDLGINKFTWLMIRFMLVMVPVVFVINGLMKGDWSEAFMFALAVAVGLTPEMLPMIVTVCLSKGALAMSKRKVIVKRLSAIQNFGAIDVLCTDKTGTLTQDQIILEKHLDVYGEEDDGILEYAYVNSMHQTGLKSALDRAVLQSGDEHAEAIHPEKYEKVDEVPFDFVRRRMSVVVHDTEADTTLLICKGAVEEVFASCDTCLSHGQIIPLDETFRERMVDVVRELNEDGFRVVALGYKAVDGSRRDFGSADETGLTLAGYLAFLDPPKETAALAIAALAKHGVGVKILTGDNNIVTARTCRAVGLDYGDRIVLGEELDRLSDQELSVLAEKATVFAKLEPAQKQRLVAALRQNGHVVGFLGDGINDAPALRTADVGISVDTAVDIAKESADIILLEKSLLVLEEGVIEGRKVFNNITKYIKMGASSNFGNMFSVLGASAFLPFLPMLPLQILVNNLLYDFSQTAIPTDNVDEEFVAKPKRWGIENIKKFILCVGPISSIFDYGTFFMMLYVFNAWETPALFQTGWFVESLLSQTMIVHIIRTNKVPFLQSRASVPLMLTTGLVCLIGLWLPFSPVAQQLGLVGLPAAYWPLLLGMLFCYAALTQTVKLWLLKRFGIE